MMLRYSVTYLIISMIICGISTLPADNICDEPTESYGLIPPEVPNSFVMKSLIIDKISGELSWEEKYFDPDNYRGKYVVISHGTETTYIFNYVLEKITKYDRLHPGDPLNIDGGSEYACQTNDMFDSNDRFMIGYKFGKNSLKRSNMYSSNELLEFGGPYKYAYDNGNLSKEAVLDRGIDINAFDGCIYDKYSEKTVRNKFYWSKDLITGSGMLSTPVRVESEGGFVYEEKEWIKIKTVSDIVWFEDNPPLPNNLFQIPPILNCNTGVNSKQIPEILPYFSTRMEAVVFQKDLNGALKRLAFDVFEEQWYDFELQLARRDYHPGPEESAQLKLTHFNVPLSTVYDYNTGIAYYTDKTNKVCISSAITQDSLFSKTVDDLNVSLAKTEDIFDLGFGLFYKGQYTIRDLQCEAWSGAEPLTSDGSFREIYFTTGPSHFDVDNLIEFNNPVRITELKPGNNGDDSLVIVETNYYKFEAAKPLLSEFDIPECVAHHKQRSFSIDFDGDDHLVLITNHNRFIDAARLFIASVADLGSPLRVQELKFYISEIDKVDRLTFTLLDSPTIQGSVKVMKKGVKLDVAVKKLKRSVESKSFTVTFVDETSNEHRKVKTRVTAIEHSMREINVVTNYVTDVNTLEDEAKNTIQENEYLKSGSFLKSDHQTAVPDADLQFGYPPESLAGLAIGMLLIGIFGGFGVMWFYLRRVQRRGTETAEYSLWES